MVALLAGIPTGILTALVAWFLGAGWFWVLVAYGLGGTAGCLGVATLGWFLKSGRLPAGRSGVGKQGAQLARAPIPGRKPLRELRR